MRLSVTCQLAWGLRIALLKRRELAMRTYSHSQLEAFETCPLKYKWRYIDRIEKPEEETVEAFVGSRVHEALQKLYEDLGLAKIDSLEELLAHYRAQWQKEWKPTIKIVRPDFTPENYFDYGAQCLRNYYECYHPFNQSQTLKTETRIFFTLDPAGQYRLRGVIDRVARRLDGTYEIHDYKTGRSLPPQPVLDADRQLGLYQLGLMNLWPDAQRVELLWHYVGFKTTLRSQRRPEQLEVLRADTIQLIDRIEAEKDFEPRKNDWCDWCEFRAACPLWKHVVAVEALPAAEFAADAGVQLANEYARTKEEIDRLEERLERVREQILEFCRQQQVRVLAGDGVRVAVKFQEKTKLPGKGEPLREQLEEFVRSIGRWDEVSSLNLSGLVKVLENEEWPADLLAQLRRFATAEAGATVRVIRTESRTEDQD